MKTHLPQSLPYVLLDSTAQILSISSAALALLGWKQQTLPRTWSALFGSTNQQTFLPTAGEQRQLLVLSDQRYVEAEVFIAPRKHQSDSYLLVLHEGRTSVPAETVHLETMGELAAGVAHEINTPLQYISDNTRFVQDQLPKLLELVQLMKSEEPTLTLPYKIQQQLATVDAEFLQEELPRALQQTLDGLEQIISIVHAMKQFSHQGKERVPTQVNDLVRQALTLSRGEWKYSAKVKLELDASLAPIACIPSALSQALLNLITNAAHAIQDRSNTCAELGQIRISTRAVENGIELSVADNGCGIPASLHERIFEPFFTTKKAGRGTGQGLALVRSVLVDQHKGSIKVESAVGTGTTFRLFVPF